MSGLFHKLLAFRPVEAVAAIVAVAIVMAGLAIPVGSHAAHAPGGAPNAHVTASIAEDCSQPATGESLSHQKHMACGANTACFVFATVDGAAFPPSVRKQAYSRGDVHRLVNWIVTPPSPPPKSITLA